MESLNAASTIDASSFTALNDDVLCAFFELMATVDPPHSRSNELIGPSEVRFPLGWIYLTHVNRRWRRLLLAMPSLWAKVFSVMPEAALEETLSRAGDAPWHIMFDNNPYSHRYKKLIALVQSHMERVRVLCNPIMFDWFPVLHDTDLSELVELDIIQHPQCPSDILLRCPNLADCTLRYLPARLVAPSLRRLVLRGNPAISSSAPHFLDTLSALPCLEELELFLLAQEPLVWNECQGPSVTLTRLRSLVLFGTWKSDMVGFWHRVVLPQKLENIRVTYSGNAGWGPVVDAFAPYLAHEFCNALAFRRGEGDLFELCAFTLDVNDAASRNPSARHRGASLEISPLSDSQGDGDIEEDDDGEPLMQEVLPRMLAPLKARADQITHMSFDTFNRFDMHDELADPPFQPHIVLRNELRAFTSVTSVSGRVYNFDFSILSVSDEDDWETDSESDVSEKGDEEFDSKIEGYQGDPSLRLFPRLTTLIVRIDESGSDVRSLKGHWKEINAVLESRSQAGIPVQRLELIGSLFLLRRVKQRLLAVQEKGLARAKSFGLQDFVDNRVDARHNRDAFAFQYRPLQDWVISNLD